MKEALIILAVIVGAMFIIPAVIWAIGRTWIRFLDWLFRHA
jgi:hypothetical protein